jgi:pimeloyl-ACP methyl ester carboxylesterase
VSSSERQIWVVLYQGFTQSASRSTGFEKLWERLGDLRCDLANRELRDWNSSPGPLAERIWRLSYDNEMPPKIIVAGYSYGGTTAVNFCRSLWKRGLVVDSLFLADPVWRPFSFLPSLRSLCPWKKLFVPRNVLSCYVTHQRANSPCGHQVIAENDKLTQITGPFLRSVTHEYMDDDKQFHRAVYNAAYSAVIAEKKRIMA